MRDPAVWRVLAQAPGPAGDSTGVSDETNPWISGSMAKPADVRGERGAHKQFHVLVTTNANVYQAWQVRVMHYWYERMRERCEDEDPDGCQMGGFTRILHDKADALVDDTDVRGGQVG